MVWGVGPWEHDFASLATEPPPDEIATAVALSAVAREKTPDGGTLYGRKGSPAAEAAAAAEAEAATAAARAELPLRAPLCLDVSPALFSAPFPPPWRLQPYALCIPPATPCI